MAKNSKLKSGADTTVNQPVEEAMQSPTVESVETAAEIAEAQGAEDPGIAPGIAGKIGPAADEPAGVTAPTGLQREFDRLQQSREDAEHSVRLAARHQASGGELNDQDQKDLAVHLRTANWTPQMYAVEVEAQKARLALRDAARNLPESQRAEKEAAEQLAALEKARDEMLAKINKEIEEAKLGVLDAQSRVREANKAKQRLRASAPPKIRTLLTNANQALGAAEERLRDAERKANNLAEEIETLQRRIATLAPETAEAEALTEELSNKKLAAKTAGAAVTDARRAVESAAEALEDAQERCELA